MKPTIDPQDNRRMQVAAKPLLRWLYSYPGRTKGHRVQTYVEVNGIKCRLTLEPVTFINSERLKRAIRLTRRPQEVDS